MVKLTIIGRVSDGLPLAQGPRYVNHEENDSLCCYKQQGEFILKEISRGSLTPSKMTIHVDHHSFNYMVENGVCFITLCDSSYPRKLCFHYLKDLQQEFEKFHMSFMDKITKPYSLIKFDSTIAKIKRQYIDTRTQANLSKLNAKLQQDLDVVTEDMSRLVQRRQRMDLLERAMETSRSVSPIWGSPLLEVIALKWTPITIVVIVAAVLLWTSFVLTDSFIISM